MLLNKERCINTLDSPLSILMATIKHCLSHLPLYVSRLPLLLTVLGKVSYHLCPDYCNCILNDHTDQARIQKCLESKYLRLMVSKSNSMGQLFIFLCSQDKVNLLNIIHQIPFLIYHWQQIVISQVILKPLHIPFPLSEPSSHFILLNSC